MIEISLAEAEKLRARVGEIGELADLVCGYLKEDAGLPEVY